MFNWLKTIFSSSPATDDERVLSLQAQLQSLKLELEEKNQTITQLKQQLQLQEKNETNQINTAIKAEREKFLTDASASITQLLTQSHLLLEEGKPVQAKDIITVATSLIRTLEEFGLTLVGKVGTTVNFDPNYHQPLRGNINLNPGQEVVIKIVGVSYQSKIIRKALVEVN
jgi:molecular chaperone GrpE (heat shock protein)